jgi:hypothetical protein
MLAKPLRLLDDAGKEVHLGRAQADLVRRAQALGLRGARIRLAGGREVNVDSIPRPARLARG